MMSNGRKFDCIIVGGGLQAGLIFQALRHYQPDTSVLMIERAEELFGNHTWSFHASDIPHQSWQWLSRNPITTWQSYSVCFPGYERHVPIRYCSIASAAMRESFSRASKLADPMPVAWGTREVQTGVAVERVGQEAVELADGRKYRADLVIDCRGRASELGNANRLCGFQKFHGFEFEIADQAALEPVLMDARVDQEDGFRFLYVLPLQPGRVLVEDTRFSDYPQLSRAKCLQAAAAYLKSKGVHRCELVREETGCLPMPYGRDMRPQAIEPLQGGYAGGCISRPYGIGKQPVSSRTSSQRWTPFDFK